MSSASTTNIDTADVVRHGPTGEEWVVAYVEGEHLTACGWPETRAPLNDCTLVAKAPWERRQQLLEEMSQIRGDDSRKRHAQRVLAAETIDLGNVKFKVTFQYRGVVDDA